MSVVAPTVDSLAHPGVPTDPIFRLTVGQYHEMLRAGILEERAPVELLDGWLVQKMTINPSHSATTESTVEAIRAVLPAEWSVRTQQPVTLAASEPEPDLAVVRGHPRTYRQRHPHPQDVTLIVEIADATLDRDQTTKKRLYAEAGIPTYWIVNLPERRLEVFWEPAGAESEYRHHRVYQVPSDVPMVIDGREVGRIPVESLLP